MICDSVELCDAIRIAFPPEPLTPGNEQPARRNKMLVKSNADPRATFFVNLSIIFPPKIFD